jgi:Cu+-exporting ATPase
LQKNNLDSFYSKRSQYKPATQSNIDNSKMDYETFDTQAFSEEFISTTKDGYSQANFYIKGITCFACVWLNENILLKQDGIIEADINMGYKTANIIWDKNKIKPSDIIKTINSIGYDAYAYTQDALETSQREEKKDYLSKLWVAFFATFNIMMIDVAKYNGIATYIDDSTKFALHTGELVLASMVIFYSGSLFAKKAYLGLKNRVVNMEFLVYLGAMLSYCYSIWLMFNTSINTNSHMSETYFDSVVMIIAFVLLGKYLEILAKENANKMLKNISLMPLMINTIKNLKDTKIANIALIPKLSRFIKKDDLICIKTNERIVVDGIIIRGSGYFDTSVVNGESKKVYKKVGDSIISGSIYKNNSNLDTNIIYQTNTNAKNSFLGKLSNILENKKTLKHKFEQKIALIASYFTITILVLAFSTFIAWSFIDSIYIALIIAISVIVVSCPCSLALAIPISAIVSLNALIKKNIICKKTSSLDKLTKSKYFIFDKTNTLTNGEFKVTSCNMISDVNIGIDMACIMALSSKSNHLISLSVNKYIKNKYSHLANTLPSIKNYKQIPSKGIKANIKGSLFMLGNKAFLEQNNINCKNIKSSNSICYIGKNNKYIGHFELQDELKKEATEVVKTLKNKNIKCVILSGDNKEATKYVANILGINYKSNMSVKNKKKFVLKAKQNKKNGETITMIGDGLNDVLALNASDVSISFSNSDNITIKSSDILLNNSNLKSIISLVDISKTYTKTIKQNLGLSFGYNLILIPLAITGFISPLIAALCMSSSSLLVVLNSLRVARQLRESKDFN